MNFMTNFTGAKLFADRPFASKNFGKASWDAAIAANYNPQQIKTALQQLGQHGYGIGSGLRTERMQGVKGAAHGMSKYQGPHGNLGINSYEKAKAAGHTPQEIYSGALESGMFLPERAMAQYIEDITPLPPEPGEIPLPGTQTGAHNVNNYSASGLQSPRPENFDLNTGGTTAAFGRKKKPKNTANALSINPVTL